MPVNDPYAVEDGDAPSRIPMSSVPGSDVILNQDGTADISLPEDQQPEMPQEHFANLAETMDQSRLQEIATDLLEAIEIDKEARKKRDEKYEEGIKRTGLGDEAPGGAEFPGASRAVHPVLLEATIDFASRVAAELLPPGGPVKEFIIGDTTPQKEDIAKRTARYMNLQMTELMPDLYHEFEQGMSQCALGGAFYTKMFIGDDGPSMVTIPIDKVHRPWSDGSIYNQPRITHEQDIDRWQFEDNVRRGLWMEVRNPSASNELPEQTRAERATDRAIGRSSPAENIDNVSTVYETSTKLQLNGDDDEEVLPYIVTVDEHSKQVLSIYRNWQEDDANQKRLDFLIEWPFVPWRGGYPIGMSHMISSLSGAATGALRALLDAAMLNTVQTGMKLKGGATVGGQNIRARVGQTTEVQGSLAMDDIRKTYMPLPFREPSAVMFQLLGFLVDASRGMIRTTFDEFDKMSGNTPVGTANMFVEQGLKNLGAIFGRQHRSMRRFLKQLWELNARTVDNAEVQDKFGELMVTAADFQGPMAVVPVSDPRIFSDAQRTMIAQVVIQRANDPVAGALYQRRKAELYFLEQMHVPQPEQFLVPAPEPVQMNAVAENTTASNAGPIKAFPGQDHEAHIATHLVFIQSPIFGSNSLLATKCLPILLAHLGEHLALWYADASLEAANASLRLRTGDPTLTIEALAQSQGDVQVSLDRMLAELSPEVMLHAQDQLGEIIPAIEQAQALLKKLAPPMPMDPSAVAAQDVQRQSAADEAKTQVEQAKLQATQQGKLVDINAKRESEQRKEALAAQKQQLDAEQKDRDRQQREADAERQHELALTGIASGQQIAEGHDDTTVLVEEMGNDTAIEVSKLRAKQSKGAGNISTGTSLSE